MTQKMSGIDMDQDLRLVSDGGTQNKVANLIEKFELDDVGADLERRWVSSDEEGMSLRELAEFFNKKILRGTIEDSNLNQLEVEIDNIYTQLTSDDMSSGVQTRVRRRLDRNGIDVESLQSNFVSHQTMHTYLTECRDIAQKELSKHEKRQTKTKRIKKLQNRCAAVTKDAVESLQRDDMVPEGSVDVVVDIQVIYPETGEQYNIYDLIGEDS